MTIHEKYQTRSFLWELQEQNSFKIVCNNKYKEIVNQLKKENEEINKIISLLTNEIEEDKKNHKEWR